MIIEDKKKPDIPIEVKDSANEVIIATSRLKAIVNSLTGVVAFYNDNGQLLLKEKDGTSKTITATVFDGF